MNIYFVGMCIAMVIYTIIGGVVSRKVKDANDFYVSGRNAPVVLIVGSMIASSISTGLFMGEAGMCYEGAFSSVVLYAGMQPVGYMLGAVFFGRYLRRSNVTTIPEFFGKRFCSKGMKNVAAVIAVIMMVVYLVSVIQGMGTLMSVVTGVSYNACVILTVVILTFITVLSGARGVLITDTIMTGLFTVAMLIAAFVIAKNVGGWNYAIGEIASDPAKASILAWTGKAGVLYNSGMENMVWGLINGVVWLSVGMVGPWQSSRYLMAKDEHTVIRSAPLSSFGLFLACFLVYVTAAIVNVANPPLEDSSHVMIWAAMNLIPKWLGVVLLTGILSAGISSATTFLSLIGASIASDIIGAENKKAISAGRISMIITSVVVLLWVIFNPPQIFWVMYFGSSIVASTWLPVVVACIFSKKVTKTAAIAGMITGFVGCFLIKLYSGVTGIVLPVLFEPSVVGAVLNIIVMIIVSKFTRVTKEEQEERNSMFVIPESEKNVHEVKKTLNYVKFSFVLGIITTIMLLVLWVIPYINNRM